MLRAFLVFICVLSVTVIVNGQGKQAIVVLRSEQSSATGCDGNVDLTYQILYDVKINNKDEIQVCLRLSHATIMKNPVNEKFAICMR